MLLETHGGQDESARELSCQRGARMALCGDIDVFYNRRRRYSTLGPIGSAAFERVRPHRQHVERSTRPHQRQRTKMAAMTIQKQEGVDVMGLSARVRNDNPAGIAALWSQFFSSGLRERLPNAIGGDIHGVYHDYEGDQSAPYVMTIGYRVPTGAACPAGLSRVSIPPQAYAVFEAVGVQPDTLISQWATIWKSDLDRAYIADFDTYDAGNKERVTVNVGVKGAWTRA